MCFVCISVHVFICYMLSADMRICLAVHSFSLITEEWRTFTFGLEDGGNIGGSGVHFPATPGKYLADLRSRANSQQYSSIYEDQRPKIEDTERSDGKKSAQGQ